MDKEASGNPTSATPSAASEPPPTEHSGGNGAARPHIMAFPAHGTAAAVRVLSYGPVEATHPGYEHPYLELAVAMEQGARRNVRDEEDELVPRRRIGLPLALFIITCVSCFWAGANHFTALPLDSIEIRRIILDNWGQGLAYMAAVLAILGAHEMGHFVATLLYRIPASLPYFIPFPISPIGTMGAVIGMDRMRANRREMFDIGIAGPLAGLVLAIPILWIGIAQLDFTAPGYGGMKFDLPVIVRMMMDGIQPAGYHGQTSIMVSQLNPLFMAGWVGLLVTGLNMMPVSQLDGGHVIYTLFGARRAHAIARGFLFFAIGYVVLFEAHIWIIMLVLVILMGCDHPPTANDRVPLGRVRTWLGYASLSIPILCFPAKGLEIVGF